MCGLGGVINHKDLLTTGKLQAVAASVQYRGPDSCGVRIMNDQLKNASEGNTAIFFNRLAIIDLDPRSDQPFEDERYLLTFNGEIYNYQELKKELLNRGCTFRTTSDTEVLFHALASWGADALKKLNGMFAFFWLDKQQRTILIARDRLGIKPLYYAQNGTTFLYGSEIFSLAQLLDEPLSISHDAVNMYLWMQFVPTPFSIYKNVYKLPPGHFIEKQIDDTALAIPQSFWDAYIAAGDVHHPQSLEQLLKNSLDRQLHADVPLGLFLSSGIDSSLLAALVNKHFSSTHSVNFFSVQFEETTLSDESKEAVQFIRAFNNPNLQVNTIQVNPGYIRDHLENLYEYYDEPFGDHAALLNWAISAKAREHVTVAVSGDGADELFWGYSRYKRWQQFSNMNRVPVLASLARSLQKKIPSSTFRRDLQFVFEEDAVNRHFELFLPSGMRWRLDSPITQFPMWALQGTEAIAHRSDLPSVLDMKTYLSDAMLYKVDRSSMACSLEVRVPYLDNEVVDYALTMPLSEKSARRYSTKAPLKQLLTELAPHYDIRQPKRGFNFPLGNWLKGNWKDLVLATVDKRILEEAGLNAAPYLKLVDDFYRLKNNYFTDVWYIFNLALWMKTVKKPSGIKHA